MKALLFVLALSLGAAAAQAQTAPVAPPTDPLAVSPIDPRKSSEDSAEVSAIRSRIEALGYTDVTGLERDSTGLWYAQATKDGTSVAIALDKGGRILRR